MQETLSQHIIEARKRFPRGLEQPEGSLRFGADALLLAAFAALHLPPEKCAAGAASHRSTLVAELGCGCGAALLGLAMLRPQICGLGLERENPLVLAAESNASRLGLLDRLRFFTLDLEDAKAVATLPAPVTMPGLLPAEGASLTPANEDKERSPDTPRPGVTQKGIARPDTARPHTAQPACNRLDAVLANPPYDRGGRSSQRHMRERALRTPTGVESHKTALDAFCGAAATLLRHQGRFFCIYDAQALPRLCAALNAVRLGVRRILPVQSHRDEPALRVLVEARKNAAHDTVLETPLILHDAPDSNALYSTAPCNSALCGSESCGSKFFVGRPLWSAEALVFCPWLGDADSSHTAANAFTAP